MKRTTARYRKLPDLILTSDWHLRDDTPPCRTDDFQAAQWRKVEEVSNLQKEYKCPMLHAGDLLHHWKPSPWLISKAIEALPEKFVTVFGQHELPNHSLDLVDKSGSYTLMKAGVIEWIREAGNFGQEPALIHKNFFHSWNWANEDRKVAAWHRFVWDGKNIPWPDCVELTARKVLKKYPQFDLIVTGDHHKPFTYEYEGRLLVNCGCLTRQVADYADHRPRVYLWYSDSNTVVPHFLDAPKGVVSREHLEEKEQRDQRIDAFVAKLSDTWEVSLSFEENLKRFVSTNKLRKSVVDLIYKSLEEQ